MRVAILNLFLLQIIFVSQIALAENWKLVVDENNIKVYSRSVSFSKLKEFKSETVVETTLDSMIALLDDINGHSNWMFKVQKGELLKIVNKNIRYGKSIIAAPWPVKKREFIYKSIISQDKDTKIVTIKIENAPDYQPRSDDYVRVEKAFGFWKFIPIENNKIKVVNQMFTDPGGAIPKWMLALYSKKRPFKTLLNMRKAIMSEKYQKAVYNDIKK